MKTLPVYICLWAAVALFSCRSTAPTGGRQSVARDSVLVRDSVAVRHEVRVRDSVRVKDSTVIVTDETGRVLKEEHYRETERHRDREDELKALRSEIDRLRSMKSDTVQTVIRETVERDLPWYDEGFMWIGRVCCVLAAWWLITVYLKKKKICHED